MNLLLDTHALIWNAKEDQLLTATIKSIIDNPSNRIYVSIVSFYELAIKMNIGKLGIGKSLLQFYMDTMSVKIEVLPIAPKYLEAFVNLPLFPNHKDPFDRLIIATALTDNLAIISADNKFSLYNELVTILW